MFWNLKKNIILPSHLTILNNFLGCNKYLKSIRFQENSELQIFSSFIFEDILIESFTIPSKVFKFENGWCRNTEKLNNVKIDPNNKNFQKYNDQIFHNCKYLKNIYFEDNSELSAINLNAFSGTQIENLTIPENACNIKECLSLNGSNIKLNIDSKNKHIINYKDEFILGKRDTNKEIFDIICFTQRKFEKVTIPSFMKRINSWAYIQIFVLLIFQ